MLPCGFRQEYSFQNPLIQFLQKSEKYINKSGAVGRVLIDLLKVFQWLKGSNMDADPAEF